MTNRQISDHLGNTYNSIGEMCREYSINPSTYKFRIASGMTVEMALTSPINKNTCVDHLGNVYKSINQMCKYYNISPKTFRARIQSGKTLKEALTEKTRKPFEKGNICTDSRGKEYRSYAALAREYGIPASVLRDRLRRGLSVSEALIDKQVTDHLGNIYHSETKMCRAYGINITTYKYRISQGWSIEKALTTPKLDSAELLGKSIKDHQGRTYRSEREMCQAYGIDRSRFRHKIAMGATLEEALTPHIVIDHNGVEYRSEFEMCRAHHIDNSTFRYRIREGFSIEEALTIPRHYSLGEYRVSKVLDEFCETGELSSYLHNVQIKKMFELMGWQNDYSAFMDIYENELGKRGISISRRRLAKFRFDFSLIQKSNLFAFVEFDGIQHFSFIDIFFRTISDYCESKDRDKAKNAFAELNRIPLLRIRYDQIEEATVRMMISDLINFPNKYVLQHNTFLSNEDYMSVFKENYNAPFQIEIL